MDNTDTLPASSRALWITVILTASLLLVGAVASVMLPPDQRGQALLIVIPVALVGVVYLLSLRSIRTVVARIRLRTPAALVFPVAQSEALSQAIALLPGVPVMPIVQFVGVSVDEVGISLWMNGRDAPVATMLWTEVTSVRVGGEPIDHAQGVSRVYLVRAAGWKSLGQLKIAAVTIDGMHYGRRVTLPLAVYSAGTAYPASRAQFSATVDALIAFRPAA